MGYGYGAPVFNFYPPLASYVALTLRALGASFLTAIKLAMLLSLIVGALSMYALARSFFGVAGASAATESDLFDVVGSHEGALRGVQLDYGLRHRGSSR